MQKSLQSTDLIMSLNSRNFWALSQKEKKEKPVESDQQSQPYLPTLPTPASPGWGSRSPLHLLVFWGPSLHKALPFFKAQSNRYCSVQAERIAHSVHWQFQVCKYSLSNNLSSLHRAHLVCLLSLQGTAGRCSMPASIIGFPHRDKTIATGNSFISQIMVLAS